MNFRTDESPRDADGNALVTTNTVNPGRETEERFIQAWKQFALANGVYAEPMQRMGDGMILPGGESAPTYLMYPSSDKVNWRSVNIRSLLKAADLAIDDEMGALMIHSGVAAQPSIPSTSPRIVLRINWRRFVSPPAPEPSEDPDIREAIHPDIIRDNHPSYQGQTEGFRVWVPSSKMNPGQVIERDGKRYRLVPAPWKAPISMFSKPSSSAYVWVAI